MKPEVVALMDEDMTDQAASGAQGGPAAAADGGAVVEALPEENSAQAAPSREP